MIIPYLLLFLLPTQLALHLWPPWAFVFGIRVDFLAPAIYLTDILALILIFTNLGIYKKYLKHLLALLVFAAINTIFSTSSPESFYRWLKIFEAIGIGIYFAKSKINPAKVFKTLFYSAVLFSLIGIAQVIRGGTTDLFYVLGERSFNAMTPGIALTKISGHLFLRAYSTFSHPNSLAGYLGVILILFTDFKKKRMNEYIGAFLVTLCFILTFSLTASIGLIVFLLLKYFVTQKKLFSKLSYTIFYLSFFVSLILPFFAKRFIGAAFVFSQNLSQRLDLSYLAGKMVAERFLIGEGLNTFIINISKLRETATFSWLLQPVHNVPLLVLSEIGIVGLIVLFVLFYRLLRISLASKQTVFSLVILFTLITWSMDHYWFTLQQNNILLSILLGLSVSHIISKTK